MAFQQGHPTGRFAAFLHHTVLFGSQVLEDGTEPLRGCFCQLLLERDTGQGCITWLPLTSDEI